MIPHWLGRLTSWWPTQTPLSSSAPPPVPLVRPPLTQLAQWDAAALPLFVRESPAALKYLRLLGDLDWAHFPERPGERAWPGPTPAPHAPFVAALLVKLDKGLKSMPKLRDELVEQPALTWVLGFALQPSSAFSWGFDVEQSLPTVRHFNRLLRELPHAQTHFLLQSSVQLLKRELPADLNFGDEISLDTKHIIAWVKQNNPKAFISGGRFHKDQQPAGDQDCKVGFKANNNQPHTPPPVANATPTSEGLPASGPLPKPKAGDYYWGYASGVVTTKIDDWGEFVLAELTQTFDHADESYFLPLMAQTEVNLGKKPRFGALDGAYDTFYVHEYFTLAGGFAAVPWADRPDHKKTFSPDGLPLCEAGLAMPLKSKFDKQSHCLVPHEVGRYACPLLLPEHTGEICPIAHKNWQRTGAEQGCITSLPTSIGNRARHELDRKSQAYQQLYNQRSASERINSQALDLGIERPKLRNQRSITNLNTLIYVLINLRALQRVRDRKLVLAGATLPRQC
jgi:hypothetical protein